MPHNMEKYILIETATSLCSVALAIGDEISAYLESSEPKAHAGLTAVFVDKLIKDNNLKISDIDGISVSMGPGSYTGLRAGVSLAKGLCFGGQKKLLAVGTLDVLVWQAIKEIDTSDYKYIIPVLDARRMEVYTSIFTPEGNQVTPTEAHILTEDSFKQQLSEGKVLFIGDAADKTSTIINSPNADFIQTNPKASSMLKPTIKEVKAKNFRDIAYFEPLYLKEFVATVSKKKLF